MNKAEEEASQTLSRRKYNVSIGANVAMEEKE